MIYAFAFLEVGGGCVRSIALSVSSNFSGASVSLSLFWGFGFFFDRLFTYSLSAPSGLSIMLFEKVKLASQPVPSNALPVSKPLSLGLFNGNFHPLPIRCPSVIVRLFQRKENSVA